MRKVKIGFVPSHREPFGEDWGAEMRDRCVREMRKLKGLDLVAPDRNLTRRGLVRDIDEAAKVLDLFIRERVEGIIIGGMTFGHETSAVGVIAAGMPRGTPVLQFATKGAPISKEGTRPSDSWCGQFMITSALHRRKIPFEHIDTCFPEEPVFASGVSRFVRATAASSGFHGIRIGQIGARPEEFESVWWDEATLQERFNQTVVPIDLDEAFSRVEAIPDKDRRVAAIVRQLTRDVDTSRLAAETYTKLAKFEVMLEQLAREKHLVAMGVNCWTRVQQRIGISICSVLGRLTEKGIMCSCEVDIYGAASMRAAYLASLEQVPPHFIDWTELHPKRPNVWLAWHCGNAPRSLCQQDCKPCYWEHSIIQLPGTKGTLEFKLRPGPVTCMRLVEYDGHFKMFIGLGEVIDCGPFVRGSGAWVKVNDVFDWERKMVEHGIIHHGILIHDPEVAGALESFCKFNQIEVLKGA